jgi:membrane protease YdiL (CAAX protease family)
VPKSPLAEVMLVYAVVAAASFAVAQLRRVPAAEEYVGLAVGAIFLVAALQMGKREPGGAERLGITLGGLLVPREDDAGLFATIRAGLPSFAREAGFALALAAIIFPPFALGFAVYHGPSHPFALAWPDEPASFALGQLVVVGLTEEAFFRGYVQTRLTDAWPKTVRVLGTDLSWRALLVQSVLFALVHLAADTNPERLAVFFPGLVFGWMRARRGGIGAAILFHAMSNFYSETLLQSWIR